MKEPLRLLPGVALAAGLLLGVGNALAITVDTVPTGLTVKVDGINYTAPITLDSAAGTLHTLEAPSPQPAPGGRARHAFSSWNDGGEQSHSVTVVSSDAVYIANFSTQYRLDLSVVPADGGTVVSSPADTWQEAGRRVSLTASPHAGYRVFSWEGTDEDSGDTAAVTLNEPRSVVVTFVPEDLPSLTVTTYYPGLVGSGHVFVSVTDTSPEGAHYVMIVDNEGRPVWYRKVPNHIYDFKVLPNGLLHYAEFFHTHSWTGGGDVHHRLLDGNYNDWETVDAGNGYLADGHDFQLLPNGHALMLGYYKSQMNLAEFVSGAYPNALVAGAILQELDAARNVVWQWRTWDHYAFQTYYGPVLNVMPLARNPVVDSFHLNTVVLDNDQNLLIANFMMDVQKINRATGEVMWRLGGLGNQFTFAGVNPLEALRHFSCHTPTRLPNNNLLLYSNADPQATRSSKVHEYSLDEVNRKATLVWSYAPSTDYYAWHYGSAQRLANGNTFIGWGGANIMPGIGGVTNQSVPVCTEVTPSGQVVFEMQFDNPQTTSYRAYRFDWPATNRTEWTAVELTGGNRYVFEGTGVALELLSGGGGYNACTVSREPYAPVAPLFMETVPQVLPLRVRLQAAGQTSIEATVSFNINSFGFDQPSRVTLYYRPRFGEGIFVAQNTQHNPAAGELSTTLTFNPSAGDLGEFVFGEPDLEHVAYPPLLNQVENYRGLQPHEIVAPLLAVSGASSSVNQALPVVLSWSPKGFAGSYALEVAADVDFAEAIITEPYLLAATYVWSNAAPDTTYHYRVRTRNDAGESDWAVGSFQTLPPFVRATVPNGGEVWRRGDRRFIEWQDNLAEQVVIDLYHGGVLHKTLATNASTGAYRWSIGMDLAPGSDYSIRIRSATNPVLSDLSDAAFSLVDAPVIDAGSVTLLPDGRTQFGLAVPGAAVATVWGATHLAPAHWEILGTVALVDGNGVFTEANTLGLPWRFYRVTVP